MSKVIKASIDIPVPDHYDAMMTANVMNMLDDAVTRILEGAPHEGSTISVTLENED